MKDKNETLRGLKLGMLLVAVLMLYHIFIGDTLWVAVEGIVLLSFFLSYSRTKRSASGEVSKAAMSDTTCPRPYVTAALGVFILLLLGYLFFSETITEMMRGFSAPEEQVEIAAKSSEQLASAFEMDTKHPDTSLYYSESLGVGFTYRQIKYKSTTGVPVVREEGKEVTVVFDGREPEAASIEVFGKDSVVTLAQAIKDTFLADADPQCEVEIENAKWRGGEGYLVGEIAYFGEDTGTGPWWADTVALCNSVYGSGGYFLFNPEVPEKYVFVRKQQAILATDGSVALNELGIRSDWTHSIRIIE